MDGEKHSGRRKNIRLVFGQQENTTAIENGKREKPGTRRVAEQVQRKHGKNGVEREEQERQGIKERCTRSEQDGEISDGQVARTGSPKGRVTEHELRKTIIAE